MAFAEPLVEIPVWDEAMFRDRTLGVFDLPQHVQTIQYILGVKIIQHVPTLHGNPRYRNTSG